MIPTERDQKKRGNAHMANISDTKKDITTGTMDIKNKIRRYINVCQ